MSRGRRDPAATAWGVPLAWWLAAATLAAPAAAAEPAEQRLLELIRQDRPWSLVPAELFDALGWDLPDAGVRVRELADRAPGGAIDPLAIERIDASRVGYRSRWWTHRYAYYGLEWDITALQLEPLSPEPGLPTLAFVNGGAANWYEFLIDPMHGPGLAQYLAQKLPVLLITIPGNYRPGGWPEPVELRQPQYLLDRTLPGEEQAARHALFTFRLIGEGVAQLVERAVAGRLLIAGHSTGGELQFLLKERLRSRLQGLSLGWGTGGPARLRREWDDARGAARSDYPPLTALRYRSADGYASSRYVGPLNPVPGADAAEAARGWFARVGRGRPQFKQVLQDIEHRGEHQLLPEMVEELSRAVAAAGLRVDAEQVAADYFSTLRSELTGYRRMLSNSGSLDAGHWAADPEQAREVTLGARFRDANPGAQIRVLAYQTPMTHYGHIERPRSLAAALLVGVRWLMEADGR